MSILSLNIGNRMNILPQCLNLGPKSVRQEVVKFSFSLPELKILKNGHFPKGIKGITFSFVVILRNYLILGFSKEDTGTIVSLIDSICVS